MESFENPSRDGRLSGASGGSELSVSRPIRVSCPSCLKIYLVDPREIREPRPRFECLSCHKRFWLAYPESLNQGDIIGFPLEWIENSAPAEGFEASVPPAADAIPETVDTHTEIDWTLPGVGPVESGDKKHPCPKCSGLNAAGALECGHCGIIFSKYEALQSDPPGILVSKDVKARWDQVIRHYDSDPVHHEFILACQRENALDYAAFKYRKILDAHGGDEKALKFRDQIVVLASHKAEKPLREERARQGTWPLTSIILFLSAVVMVTGYLVPSLRNMVGAGAAIMFFTLAIRFYFGR